MSNQLQRLGSGIVTTAEAFWYILACIGFGAGYLAKVPVKKALAEYGLVEMTAAEKFWYVVENIAFASGYFSKVIIKKALSEVRVGQQQYVGPTAPMGV
ncbi:MAG TPA: hypothetical protein VFW65_18195 [Pseudonocardiaceae bacterium]|nr:hypothetical protein [Pseudonocardiaceae bacterium]